MFGKIRTKKGGSLSLCTNDIDGATPKVRKDLKALKGLGSDTKRYMRVDDIKESSPKRHPNITRDE